MKAILIDSAAREIRAVEYTTSEDLRGFVGGYIEAVPLGLPNGTDPPGCSPRSLAQFVRFIDRFQFDAWAKANASEPAIAFTSFGPDGTQTTEVIQRFGSLFGDVPRPKEEDHADDEKRS